MQPDEIPEVTPEMLEQNPLLMIALIAMGVIGLSGLFGSLLSWGWMLYRLANQQAVVALSRPWEPRRWALTDLGFAILTAGIVPSLFVFGWNNVMGKNPGDFSGIRLDDMAISGLATLICVAIVAGWILQRYRASAGHLGFRFFGWPTLGYGVLVGLATIPVIFFLNAIVAFTSKVPYEHPLIDSANESATIAGYLMACFAAVIAAPIAEEFLFRSIIQGWLQSIPFKSAWDSLVGTSAGRENSGTGVPSDGSDEPPTIDASTSSNATVQVSQGVGAGYGLAVENGSPVQVSQPPEAALNESGPEHWTSAYSSSEFSSSNDQDKRLPSDELPVGTSRGPIPPIWPSFVVGILFGLAHFQYGLSWIPLSVLGTVLGLVYRQTHSILPCVVIHMMMNGFAMLALGVTMLLKNAAG